MKKSEIDVMYSEEIKEYETRLAGWQARWEATEPDMRSVSRIGPRPKPPRVLIRPTECEVEGCKGNPIAKGFCGTHYASFRNGRDPHAPTKLGRPVLRTHDKLRKITVELRPEVVEAVEIQAVKLRTNRSDAIDRILALLFELPEFAPEDPRASAPSDS